MNNLKIIRDFKELATCALALGNFDGIHIAHREIIEKCKLYADENNMLSGVLLFENHTKTVLENRKVKLLTPLSEKIKIIEQMGIDFVFIKPFDEVTMQMRDEEFISFLTREMKASALFAGYDYTFGYKASGNSRTLMEFGEKAGIHIEIIERIDIMEEPVSSSLICNLVRIGKTDEVKRYLKRPYSVFGSIEKGKQNGTKMGIPTANLGYEDDKLLPSDGVYTGEIVIDNESYKALINIGKNPTFDADKRTLEVHIPGFSGNIYGAEAQVIFNKKIREEIKFNSPGELTEQIKKDLELL